MKPGVGLLLLLTSLQLLPTVAAAAGGDSDASRLHEGLPRAFVKPHVVVYPVRDIRALGAQDAAAAKGLQGEGVEAWQAFESLLRARENLRLTDSRAQILTIQRAGVYRELLQRARDDAAAGYTAYQEVRLDEAIERMRAAEASFVLVEHHIVRPKEVARVALTQGLALLESGQDPAPAFARALLFDPALRLRVGFDRAEAIEAFESARKGLLSGPSLTEGLQLRTRRPPSVPKGAHLVRGLVRVGRLSVTIISPDAIREDSEPLDGDPQEAASRLASRLWCCLPFGRFPARKTHDRGLYIDAGFAYNTFYDAPVEAFGNTGAAANVRFILAEGIGLDLNASLTNSNRDREEDLRDSIGILRIAAGPGLEKRWGRWRLMTTVGFEYALHSAVVTTGNPACKLFEVGQVPPTLCSEEDIDRVDGAQLIGLHGSVGVAVAVAGRVYLTARASTAKYIFRTDDSGLKLPFGLQFGLGYQLF